MGILSVSQWRRGRVAPLILFACVVSATALTARAATDTDAIARAKAVMAAHDRAANSDDLDAVMVNIADDVVVLAPGLPLVKGKEAFRTFYVGMLQVKWDTAHHFEGADQVGDVVVLYGVASGTMTPRGGPAAPAANNFVILLKPDRTGAYKIWRAAFGPIARE